MFFLTIRAHPRFTLFPYTTLFRSHRFGAHRMGARGAQRPVEPAPVSVAREHRARARSAPLPRRPPDGRDRKSTRLNSSHRCISYAVFCLKKKKIAQTAIETIYNLQ